MSGELDNNEWLIRELESYDCPDNWAYCSDLAMRAATALHLAEDVVVAKNAEMERLRLELEVERTANRITENHNHLDCAVELSRLRLEIEQLRGIQRAVVALARTVLGKSEHPVKRSPWIDVIHMMNEEARRER